MPILDYFFTVSPFDVIIVSLVGRRSGTLALQGEKLGTESLISLEVFKGCAVRFCSVAYGDTLNTSMKAEIIAETQLLKTTSYPTDRYMG